MLWRLALPAGYIELWCYIVSWGFGLFVFTWYLDGFHHISIVLPKDLGGRVSWPCVTDILLLWFTL